MKFFYSACFSVVTCLFIAGCSYQPTQEYQDVYSDSHQCNGDMEISHKLVINKNPKDVSGPEVSATCVPKAYDPQTDFEKENRKQRF